MKKSTRMLCALICLCALFSLAMPASALAFEYGYTPITKVLATTSATPVISSSALDITGATSTTGCYFNGISWYDSTGTYIDGQFTANAATVNIRLDAQPGYYFQDGLAAYLNNSPVSYVIYNDGAYIILERTYTPEAWAPTIIKHPGSERVDEGSWCSFVATASNADECVWHVLDANGQLYTMDELASAYGITYTDSTFGKLILRGIPSGLDGSYVYCTFSGAGGSVDTNKAKITVEYDKPSPTPTATPEPAATDSAATKDPVSDTAAEDETTTTSSTSEHPEHSYSREWKYDDEKHWHECECGARSDEAEHVFSWTTIREATKKQNGEEEGECSVCDYKTTREIEYVKPANSGRWILFVGIGVLALVLILMIVSAARQRRERRRQQAKHRKYYGRHGR